MEYIKLMTYDVRISKKANKGVSKLPKNERIRFYTLVDDLTTNGPVRANWPNYSKLGDLTYHCHLSHKWVAVWRHEKGTIIIEVTYAGSREDAPY